MRSVVWFRGKDLRVNDHPALARASSEHGPLIPVFVLAPDYLGGPDCAARAPHRVQFMLESLDELHNRLRSLGSDLIILAGPAVHALPEFAARAQADRVFAIGACEPAARKRDALVAGKLGVPLELCGYETLRKPGSIRSGTGGPFQVYSPFARAVLAGFEPPRLSAAPRDLPPVAAELTALSVAVPSLAQLGLARNPKLQSGGERVARERLTRFLQKHATHYDDARNRMDLPGTSRLSADLHFGTLSVRAIYTAAQRVLAEAAPQAWERYRAELLWREFSHHTLFDRPDLLHKPFRKDFEGFPWIDDDEAWEAWVAGRTGYPIVDAAARQLREEGFVHNRARMIAASFLTKQLAVHYARGEAHYLRWLTDGDRAQNNLGWQWCAGSGCDAQPYFRIFNPIAQGERYDPDGEYVRRYIPELARMPPGYIHAPFRAPANVLEQAGVTLGETYPEPCIDLDAARQRFLLTASEHLGRKRPSSK